MSTKVLKSSKNLLEEARRALVTDVATAACRAELLQRSIARLKEEATLLGYELVAAKADLRLAIGKLEAHDERRLIETAQGDSHG